MAVSQTDRGPRFTMTIVGSNYDIVIDGADFLAGSARLATGQDRTDGFVVQVLDPDADPPELAPTKLYPVHVQIGTTLNSKSDALDAALKFFKTCVGDNVRATLGRDPTLVELVALEQNVAAAKMAALRAWEA